jgi:hypothetical protein
MNIHAILSVQYKVESIFMLDHWGQADYEWSNGYWLLLGDLLGQSHYRMFW